MSTQQLILYPIGHIRTPYRSKYDAPRQPGTSRRKTIGRITLEAGHNFEQALEDLAGFDYVWILFWFDKSEGWKPKVLPPSSDRKKRGIFATRSPHRPNPIGLSLCRLREIKGRTLVVENPDLLDGTPIIDIKPYIPHSESVQDARSGWISDGNERADRHHTVTIKRSVLEKLKRDEDTDGNNIESYVRNTLARDPSPHAYRRIRKLENGTFCIAVRRWRFRYEVHGRKVSVVECWRE